MTVFSAIRSAVLRAEGTVIDDVFGSSDQVAVEMADLANDVARQIADSHSWQRLTRIASLAGDGATSAFPLPADYSRMIGGVDGGPFGGLHALDLSGWMDDRPNGWIILDDQINMRPAPTGSIRYPYISKLYARAEDGTAKAHFDANDDDFLLDERLLTLGLVVRWKDQKGLDYAAELELFNLALDRAIARDKGFAPIARNSVRYAGRIGWPWELG